MKKVMYKVDEVADLIKAGKKLLLAGEEGLLESLPKGNWVGGTIPYFMAEEGGQVSQELIQVSEIPECAEEILIKSYDISTIENVYKDGFNHGFSVIIIPSSSKVHFSFAVNAPDYELFAMKPLIGWIAGVLLEDLNKKVPKTFAGGGNVVSDKNAVVMHVKLPDNKYAEIDIINIFEQGAGDSIQFIESGFTAKEALINGEKKNFAEYVLQNQLDIKFPLVADYNSAMINISFKSINEGDKTVNFYAPIFKGVTYKHAKPMYNYVEQFTQLIPNKLDITFSCNCILNYLYSELEGKKTGEITGPITFGEIAYQLLNQTMVNLEIKDI